MLSSKEDINIRKGTQNDIAAVYSLVEELAIYHKHDPDYIDNSPQQMLKDCAGSNPHFHFFVAEEQGKIVGTAIYYFTYSTWKGKSLYLEDLIITKTHRGRNIGTMFMQALAEEAVSNDAKKMKWQVAEDNERAIGFYEKMDADLDAEWINCELNRSQLETITEEMLEPAMA